MDSGRSGKRWWEGLGEVGKPTYAFRKGHEGTSAVPSEGVTAMLVVRGVWRARSLAL